MKFCASSARTVLLVGLLLAVAAAWCAPVVQGRLLQHRDDQEDGGYSQGSSSQGGGHRSYHSGRYSGSYSGNQQSRADNSGGDDASEGDSDSSSTNAAPVEVPAQQPAGNTANAAGNFPAMMANPSSNAMQPTSGSTTAPTNPVQAPTTTPATPVTTPTTPTTPAAMTTPAATPAAGSTTGGPSDPVLSAVLALHNQLRAKHSAPPLTWSTALEQTAMAWAKGCNHEHSTNRQGNYNELNAWGNRPFTQAVTDQWYSEIKNYNFNNPPQSWSENTAHFTQVVWKSTTQLGCGYATCSDGPYYVCHYAPTGNTNGGFAANVSPPTA